MFKVPAIHQKDAYKIGHKFQYAEGISRVYSNFTARSGKRSNVPDSDGVILFGLQMFIMDYLIDEWNETFFHQPKELVVQKYQRRVAGILGYEIDVSHIEALHDLGFLPIEIRALPEGTLVPYRVPMFTVDSTMPEFYWVTNMLESVLSAEMWLPCTTATTYLSYRRLFEKYAKMTGGDMNFVPFQGHDFSFRGLAGRHAAAVSGLAHLAAGSLGTDTIPGVDLAEKFYVANSDTEFVGLSVAATEHSVMCSASKEGEFEQFKRLITEVYPTGIVSIVSDTWDLWEVITDYLPRLKDEILARDGKIVIRPDSGDPVKIICGDVSADEFSPEYWGVMELMYATFPGETNKLGYRSLDPHVGVIYGDSITYERAEAILEGLESYNFQSTNIVFGIGSFTYQFVTRDTHGMAMKSTYVEIDGEGREIFKDPITDDGTKKSARGLLRVERDEVTGILKLVDQVDDIEGGLLEPVFRNGVLLRLQSLQEIRERVLSNV